MNSTNKGNFASNSFAKLLVSWIFSSFIKLNQNKSIQNNKKKSILISKFILTLRKTFIIQDFFMLKKYLSFKQFSNHSETHQNIHTKSNLSWSISLRAVYKKYHIRYNKISYLGHSFRSYVGAYVLVIIFFYRYR